MRVSIRHRVCRFWAVVFVFALVCFATAPSVVAALLNSLAGVLGLQEGVAAGPLTLWYPLALSLMATITYLAWVAGTPGAPPQAWRALLLSKLCSSAGFAVLAVTTIGAWWLAVATDGFIALTLVLSARRGD